MLKEMKEMKLFRMSHPLHTDGKFKSLCLDITAQLVFFHSYNSMQQTFFFSLKGFLRISKLCQIRPGQEIFKAKLLFLKKETLHNKRQQNLVPKTPPLDSLILLSKPG